MITRLTLKNFKRHSELEVEFGPGLTTVIGPNYAGKSTLIDGVNFALWGPTAVAGGMAVCLKRGETALLVELAFKLDGEDYTVRRTGTTATLLHGATPIAKSASAVTTKLQELLGLNRQRFLQTKVAQQKRTEALLTAGVTELHQIIEEGAGVDVVTRILGRAKDAATHAQAGLEALPEGEVEPAEQAVADLTQRAANLTRQYLQAKAEAEQASKQLTQAREALESAQQHNAEQTLLFTKRKAAVDILKKAEDELAAVDQRAQELAGSLEAWEAVDRTYQDAQQALETRRQAQAQYDAVQEQLAEVKARAHRCAVRVNHAREDLAAIEAVPAKLRQQAQDAVADAQRQQSALEAKYTELDHLARSAICPTCKRPVDDCDPAKLEAQRAEVLDQLKQARQAAKRKQEEVGELTRRHEAHSQAARALAEAEHKQLEAGEQLKALRTKAASLSAPEGEDLATLREQLTLIEARREQARSRWAELKSVQTRQQALSSEIDAQLRTLKALPKLEDMFDLVALGEAERAATRAVDARRHTASELNAEHRAAQASLTAAEAHLLHVKQTAERRDTLARRLAQANGLAKYLRTNRDRFVAEVWGGVTAYASQFASACTGGDIEGLKRGEDGQFTYYEAGEEMPVDAASGAQRSIMGLGIQLALGQLLPSSFHTLLLDEPTADMTPEVSLAAMGQMKALGQQVVAVSHRDLDGTLSDQVVAL